MERVLCDFEEVKLHVKKSACFPWSVVHGFMERKIQGLAKITPLLNYKITSR